MRQREMKRELKKLIPNMDEIAKDDSMHDQAYRVNYLGSYMALDPCGRYHHMLAPNGVTSKCERFWERLESAADELGGWIETGEGDPTDIFFCMPTETKDEEQD